jgi:hypothetical protein
MTRGLAAAAHDGAIDPSSITDELIADHLYTKGIPDVDLLIRTSGELRISNFLLWQIAYAELFFTKTLWPDFGEEEFVSIIRDYQIGIVVSALFVRSFLPLLSKELSCIDNAGLPDSSPFPSFACSLPRAEQFSFF